jgi:hypothetical protein
VKLPNKDDPHGNKEGSLPRKIVLEVLREHDVEVTDLGNNKFELYGGDELEVQVLTERVGGLMIRYLKNRFQIPATSFYYDTIEGKPRDKKH